MITPAMTGTVVQDEGLPERLLRTADQREYIFAQWDGENRSGFQPLDDKVLVLMDEHSETTQGGVHITEQMRERQNMAAETGVVVALGPAAFVWSDDARRIWEGRKPMPGDRCYIERYAGQLLQGRDGRMYRLCSQKCIGAIATGEEKAPA